MQNQETQTNSSKGNSDDIEKSQAKSGSEIREGQENSSILHDSQEGNKELPRDVTRVDDTPTSQEEFVEDKNANNREGDK